VGAKVTMLASVLLEKGIDHLHVIDKQLRQWMDRNDYSSVESLHGIVGRFHSQDPSTLERNEYIRAITSPG
jgi:dihydroorotate dehydrogenase (fumarate)